MKKWNRKGTAALLSAILTAVGLTACGSGTGAQPSGASDAQNAETLGYTEYDGLKTYAEFSGVEALPDNSDAEVITIAYGYAGYPISYTANTGVASGYDIEMLKAVDSLLPQYRFEFVPQQGGDDLLLSVQTGRTNGAVRNWFQTEERKEIFTYPQKNLGLSVTGLTVRKEDIDSIYDFATVSEAGGNLVPVDPGDAHYTVLKNWCEENPDHAWDFETGKLASATDAYEWVAEGRYDAYFSLEVGFNAQVIAEDGAAHQYADRLTWTPCAAIPTYVIFSLDDKDVADAFDSVVDEIWDSGYPSYLQESLYGVDYIGLYGRDGSGFDQ